MRIDHVIRMGVVIAGCCACRRNFWHAGTANASAPQQTTPDLPEAGAIAEVNDIEMYYEIHGEGEPLLLLHGAIGSTGDFAEVLPAFLEAGYQTIAIDNRGRGRSTDSGQPMSYDLMASDVVALMDELGIEKASIAGQSDGAIVGLDMAINYPERIDKLISYGANFNVGGLLPDNIEWLNGITQADFEAMIGEEYRQIAPDPDHLPALLEQLRHMLLTQPNFTIKDLMGIEAEVLVFDGEEEDTVRIEHAKQLAAAIPNSSMVIVPGTGHALMYEDPETYLAYAIPFLKGELDAPPDGKYAAVNDIAMYYEIHGEGEPVLLMHSIAASIEQLADVIPQLAQDHQVIAVDFRGHGRTTDAGQPLSYELMASNMVALLDQLGIDAVDIVGNKDGGIIGLVMATEYPERVKSLVAASANWSPAGFQPWFVDYVKGMTLDGWDAMAGEMYRTVAPDPSIMPVMLEKDRFLLLTRPDFSLEKLSTITVPVLVLAGADEDVLEIAHVEEMAAAIPNATLVLLSEAGHNALTEQPDAWTGAVLDFLPEPSAGYAHPEMIADTEWLADHLSDPHLRILDTRNFLAEGDTDKRLASYAKGHIPGAVYVDARDDISDPNGAAPLLILPKDDFEALMGRLGIDNDTTVVVYDDAGNTWSARLWWALRYYGHDDVKLLDGGLTKWTLEERPLEQGSNETPPTDFRAEVRPSLLATKTDVLAAIDDPDVAIIDSLEPEYYSGEWNWPNMRAGHIPTAENFFVMDNLDPANLTFLPVQSLDELWQKVDLQPDQEIITYCGAGYYGAFNLFVLYQLGYDNVRLYDGSWMEWGADLTLPVETELGSVDLPASDAAQKVPRFEASECKYPILEGANAECGYLMVQEDRANSDSAIIGVYVIKFKAATETPAPDPIIVIPGGPGASGSFYAWLWAELPVGNVMRAERDVYILEPRGAMYSEPGFYCPEMETDWSKFLDMTMAEEAAWSEEAYRACYARLSEAGVNFASYGFLDIARDVVDLSVALGIDQVNVYGVSYGTTPAMMLMHESPEIVRSVILDSIIPPDVAYVETVLANTTNSFAEVFAACAADPICNDA